MQNQKYFMQMCGFNQYETSQSLFGNYWKKF